MNILMGFIGAVLFLASIIRALNGPSPSDGDRRIIKGYSGYWVQEYSAYPGWNRRQCFETIEEARVDVERWNAARKVGTRPDEIVK